MVSIPTQAAVTAANPSGTSEENVRYTPTDFYRSSEARSGIRRYWGITNAMMLFRLVQIFCPIKEINRKHSGGYAEDLSTQRGQKRCAKMGG